MDPLTVRPSPGPVTAILEFWEPFGALGLIDERYRAAVRWERPVLLPSAGPSLAVVCRSEDGSIATTSLESRGASVEGPGVDRDTQLESHIWAISTLLAARGEGRVVSARIDG